MKKTHFTQYRYPAASFRSFAPLRASVAWGFCSRCTGGTLRPFGSLQAGSGPNVPAMTGTLGATAEEVG